MEKALAIQKEVIKILGTNEVYLVGGSVRDIVMGNTPKDYDFTTPMLPDDIEAAVKAAGRRVYNVGNGKKHGTLGFKVPVYTKHIIKDGGTTRVVERDEFEYVEVTTFRTETYPTSSRQPEVQFVTSLDEDLARRDFTMNAMVLRPDGTIYDPYSGKLHIHKKMIITVGMPKDRIQEDPLRMLRAARFAARYGFEIDPNFIGKARQLADRIYDVSVERWVQELDKTIDSDHPLVGLLELEAMGVLVRVLPEISILLNDYPEFAGITMFGENGKPSVDDKWSELLGWTGLQYVDKPDDTRNKITRYINRGICARLKFSNTRTSIIVG